MQQWSMTKTGSLFYRLKQKIQDISSTHGKNYIQTGGGDNLKQWVEHQNKIGEGWGGYWGGPRLDCFSRLAINQVSLSRRSSIQ